MMYLEVSDDVFIGLGLDSSMFILARLRAQSQTTKVLTKELLDADDAALVAHRETILHTLINSMTRASYLDQWTSSSVLNARLLPFPERRNHNANRRGRIEKNGSKVHVNVLFFLYC